MTIPPNPPFAELTPDNRGPAVIVAAFIFYTLAFITVVTRCWNRFTVLRKLGWEDWVITICVLLAFAQTVALTFAINSGLGRRRDDLSESEFLNFAKAYYVSEIFAILALTMAKISTLMLIIAIQPPRNIIMVCRGTGILTITWALAMMFAIAFECSLPTPWNYEGQCGNHEVIRIVTAIWNISTDLILVALPITMMHNVHVNSIKRWTVNGLFGSRVLVPAFALASLVTSHPVWVANPTDMTWSLTVPSVWHQCMLNLSIITACIPTIKRFLADLSVGLTVIAVSEPLEQTVKQTSSSNPSSGNKLTNSSQPGFFSGLMSRSRHATQSQVNTNKGKSRTDGPANDDPYSGRQDFQPDWATRSRPVIERSESVKGLTQNIIVQTIDYEVNFEDDPGSARHTGDQGSSMKSDRDYSESATSR